MNQTARRYRFGDATLTLAFADITTSEADVLVSSDDSYLTMGGGVSAAIRRAGGPAIALDAAKMIPAAPGDVVVTTAGALRARYVFHAVTLGEKKTQRSHREILEAATRRCMQLADALGVRSIAFPALGAGTAGFSTKIAAGAPWREEIEQALAAASVAVLLVSPDFLASDFVAAHELPPLLAAAKNRGLTILWVYLRPCLYDETEIGAYQAAHDVSRSLSSLRGAQRDNALVGICQKIKAAVTDAPPSQ